MMGSMGFNWPSPLMHLARSQSMPAILNLPQHSIFRTRISKRFNKGFSTRRSAREILQVAVLRLKGVPSNPGLIGAEIASWAAFSPSLMPRAWSATVMVTFCSQISGHIVGAATGHGFRSAISRLEHTPLARLAPPPRIERAIGLALHGAMSATTVALWLRSISRQREIGQLVGMDALSTARSQLGATATASAAYIVTQGFSFAANWGYDLLQRKLRLVLPRGVAPILAGAVVGGGIALSVDRLLIRRVFEAISAQARYLNSLVLTGRMQPWEPERSGSPWSLEPWHALGAQGRVIVAEGPRARDLAAVSKRPLSEVFEPIRIYAGKVSGRTLAAQIEAGYS